MKALRERAWDQRWAFAPVALLLASVGGLATMASIASDDPSFSLEPSYYEKAVHWDEQQAKRAASKRLGWRLQAALEPSSGGARLVAVIDRADPQCAARIARKQGNEVAGSRDRPQTLPRTARRR